MSKTMLAVVKEKSAPGVTIKQIPIPQPADDEVLIKVKYASICGTDIAIYDWTPWAAGHIKPPIVIGHEVVGEVVKINNKNKTDTRSNKNTSQYYPPLIKNDDKRQFKLGDLVSSETHIFCGHCFQCRIFNHHLCENMQLFGIGRNGGFAEYATIPIRTTWKNPSASSGQVPLEAMSVQEPLGNAVHVVTKAEVAGKKVLIIGLGPAGLCAGMVAKAYGAATVVGINRRSYRRKLAQGIGFDQVLESLPEKEYNNFDVVLEMSGSQNGIQIGFDAIRIAGIMVAFGIPKRNIELDWGKYLINKEITIKSVFGRHIWQFWPVRLSQQKTG